MTHREYGRHGALADMWTMECGVSRSWGPFYLIKYMINTIIIMLFVLR
jgi:hypothetical protein